VLIAREFLGDDKGRLYLLRFTGLGKLDKRSLVVSSHGERVFIHSADRFNLRVLFCKKKKKKRLTACEGAGILRRMATRTRYKDNKVFSLYSIAIPRELDWIVKKLAADGKSKTRVLSEICEQGLRRLRSKCR
jgi:hypothetical protein